MPNHLTEYPMVPEYLQRRARPSVLTQEMDRLLTDNSTRTQIEESFRSLRKLLKNNAYEVVADKLVDIVGMHA